ncbi:hypothetical protein [Erythrobacter sp. WG]|uniref:hypothetical protein n=1 Tax=Erythrobacter sp. WG TaxID=2985510 RepID=UPI002271DE37|nr:hypothetical protein [Erythrobacter sp. WG]MCX9147560.1 hypothetical protein [Erythrobacter sp. WG]
MNIAERVKELSAEGIGHAREEAFVRFIDWFHDKPQTYWLFAAAHYNWGYGPLPLYFMVREPQCSIAVAKQIFWLGAPDDIWLWEGCWAADYEMDLEKKLLLEINERACAGGFVHDGLEPTRNCFDERIAARIASQPCAKAPQIAAVLLAGFEPCDPPIPEVDHPEWNQDVADIFADLGTGF